MDDGSVEVVVSTHANPRALDLCLLALSRQSVPGFRVCVAEDGECAETSAVIRRRSADLGAGRIRHVSKPHEGFGKNRILNRALASSRADYLVFLDGDCLPSPRFLARHLGVRRAGRFLSGGVVRLDAVASAAVTPADVEQGRVFHPSFLGYGELLSPRTFLKFALLPGWVAGVAERLTPVARTWNGGNSSAWRSDLLAVNGFDESLGYGGEDVDLGFRLNAMSIRGRHIRYSALLLHLDHARAPGIMAGRLANTERVWAERGRRPCRTPHGIERT